MTGKFHDQGHCHLIMTICQQWMHDLHHGDHECRSDDIVTRNTVVSAINATAAVTPIEQTSNAISVEQPCLKGSMMSLS